MSIVFSGSPTSSSSVSSTSSSSSVSCPSGWVCSSSSSSSSTPSGITDVTYAGVDLAGNKRVNGSAIDIGPYEYGSVAILKINSFTATADKQLANDYYGYGYPAFYANTIITFDVDYTIDSNRTLSSIEYDYGDGKGYETSNTHVYTSTYYHNYYSVRVKVVDSEGDYSTQSMSINIQPLPFEEMTLEQKIRSLTSDTTKIDSIITDINNGHTIDVTLKKEDIDALPSGWSIVGVPSQITDFSLFASARTVWAYDNGTKTWSAYSAQTYLAQIIQDSSIQTLTIIPAKRGVWVEMP